MDTKVRSDASVNSSRRGSLRYRRGLTWLGQFLAPVLGSRAAPEKAARKDHLAFEALEPRVLLDGTPGVPITKIDGSIDVAGESDRYGFSLTSDAQIVFDSLTSSNSFNWSLAGPRGDVVSSRGFAQSDSDGFYQSPVLALSSGDYTLTVDGVADATGNYAFRLIDLSGATPITPDVPVSGTLDPGNETDAFVFDASAGDRFVFDRSSVSAINATWRLLDPFGAQVVGNQEFGDFQSGTLTLAGRYSLLLEGRAGASELATYGFRLLKSGERVDTLTVGALTTGTLESAADSVRHDFSVSATGQYYFDSLTDNAQLQWSLRGPLGTMVSPRSFNVSDSTSFYGVPTLVLGPGDYSLFVSASGDFNGDYAFRLLDLAQAEPVDLDVDVSRTLDPANGTQAFSFAANAGDRIALQQVNDAPAQSLYWRLLDPTGREISGYNYFGTYGEVPTLTVDGNYTLLIEGPVYLGSTVDYSFRIVRGVDTTEAISVGDTIYRTIDSAGQVQRFTFNVADHTRLAFDALAGDWRFNWSLYGPDGALIVQRQLDSSDGVTGVVELIEADAGDYVLVVDPYNDYTGDYGFRLVDTSLAAEVALGDEFTVVLGNTGRETQAFVFDAQSGDNVELDFTYLSGDGNVVLELFDPFGRRVARMGGGADALRMESGGRYTLLVEGYVYSDQDSEFSVYLNYLSNDGGNVLPSGAAIGLGDEITGNLDVDATPAVFNFSLGASTRMLFDALGANESSLQWTLVGPRGVEVSNQPFYATDGGYPYYGASVLNLLPGDYALTVTGGAGQAYDFRLLDMAAAAADIVPGANLSGVFDPGNGVQVFRFDGVTGDQVALSVDTYWYGSVYIVDPKGGFSLYPQWASSQNAISLGLTGTYYLVLSGARDQSEPQGYDFHLDWLSTETADIQIGDLVESAIDQVGQTRRFRFVTDTPRRVLVDTRSGDTNFEWRVTGPWGDEASSTGFAYGDGYRWSNGTLMTLLPGTHYLEVSSTSTATGNFSFRLVGVEEAAAIDVNQPVVATLDPANGMALFSFDANAGESLTFDLISSEISSSNAAWRLIGPSGQVVVSNWLQDFGVANLPETGRYLLVVEGSLGNMGSAGFSFQVVRALVSSGTPIALDDTVTANRSDALQSDRYTFTVAEPTRVYFDYLSGSTGLNWTLSGPRGTLISARGIYADSYDYGGPASIELAAGNYVLSVAGNATGAYSFRLINEENKPVIGFGELVSGQLSPGSEAEVYRFDAEAGDQIYLDVKSYSYYYAGYVRLLDPLGRQVAISSYLSDIDATRLAMAGRYTLIVEGFYYNSGATYNYAFSLGRTSTESHAISVGVASGTAPQYVEAPDGEALQLGRYTSGQLASDPALDLTGSLTLETRFRVDSFAGTWMPLVFKGNGNTGQRTYSLWINSAGYAYLTTGDNSDQVVRSADGSIVAGQWYDVAGVIDRSTGQMRLYINGQLVQSAALRTQSAISNNQPLLIGVDNETWGAARFEGAIDTLRLWSQVRTQEEIDAGRNTPPAAGASGLVLDYRFAASGGATLVDSGPRGLNGQAVFGLPDTTGIVVGRIATAGQTNNYTFSLASPTRLYIDTVYPNAGNFTWTLTGPSGVVVKGAGFSSTEQILSVPAGDYTLVVDGSLDTVGTYAFRLLDLSSGMAVAYDQVVSGTLTPGAETDVYRFDAQVGDMVYFDRLSLSAGSTRWRLLDPFGREAFGYSSFNDRDTFTLAYAGAYTLLVEGYNGDTADIAYSFSIRRVTDTTTPIVIGEPSGLDPEWVAGKSGNAIKFDANDEARIPASAALDLTGSATVEFWIKPERYNGDWAPLVFKGTDTAGQRQFSVWLNQSGYLHLYTNTNGSGQAVSTAAGSIKLGEWQHVAAVVDRVTNRLRIYINGVEAANGGLAAGTALSNSNPFMVGASLENYPRYVGAIDELRIWNTARSATDISNNKDSILSGAEAGLVGYFKFDETAGRSFVDTTASGVSGEIRHALQLLGGVEGQISSPGQQARFTFTLTEARRLVLDSFYGSSNLTWSLVGPRGTVFSGRNLVNSDAGGLGATSPVLDLNAGDYVLTVDGSADTVGAFSFRFLDITTGTTIAYDTAVSGTLDPANVTQVFHFDATAGERLFFQRTAIGSISYAPYIRLLDPFGRQVYYGSFADTDNLLIAFTGNYTLLLEGDARQVGTTAYAFKLHRIVDEAAVLSLDTMVNGSLAMPGQVDRYTFTLASDTRVEFDSLTPSNNITWSITGRQGTLASRSFYYSDSEGIGSANPFMLLKAGTYTLTVDGDGVTTGAYAFRLLTAASAQTIALDTEIAGVAIDASSTRLFRFDATAGDQVMLDFLERSNTAYPYWRLFDRNGTQLHYGYFANDSATLTLGYTGSYILAIENRITDGAGTLRFQVSTKGHVDLPVPPAGDPITLGATVSGTLTSNSDSKQYGFDLAANSRLMFDALSGTYPQWSLAGPDGTVVASRNFYASDSYDYSASPVLELGPGHYVLTVTAQTGNFSFRLLDLAAATALSLDAQGNTEVAGTLLPLSESDIFSFQAQAGDRYYFQRLQAGNSDVYMRLIGPAGNTVFSQQYQYYDRDNVTLPDTGTYYVMVEGRYYLTGGSLDYRTRLARINDPAPVDITVGSSTNGNIAGPGQVNHYRFTLDSASQIYFDALASDNDGSVLWSLTGPRGTVTGSRAFSSSNGGDLGGTNVLLDLPAGTYDLAIDGSANYTGAYRFRLLDTSDAAVSIALDTTVLATLDPANSTNVYRFDASAGQKIFFDSLATSGSVPYYRVIDPFGRVLFDTVYGANDRDVTTLTATGSYLLLVEGARGATGTASLSFNVRSVTDTSAAIQIGAVVDGTLASAGQLNNYNLVLDSNTRLFFDTLTYSNSQITWSLTGPRGIEVSSRYLNNSDSTSYQPYLDLPAGNYRLTVDGVGDATGSYQFRLLDVAAATTIQAGNVITGVLNPATEMALYKIALKAGDRLYLDALSIDQYTYNFSWRLIDPYGHAVVNQYSFTDVDVTTAAYTGDYVLAIEGQPGLTGSANYSFNLSPAPLSQIVPITIGDVPGTDLVVSNLAVAAVSGDIRSGGQVTLSWDITNAGSVASSGSWKDQIVVRSASGALIHTELVSHDEAADGPLQAGEKRSRSVTLALPDGNRGAGDLVFRVTTDVENTVAEQGSGGTAELNNAASLTVPSALSPYADLQISGLEVSPAGGWAAGSQLTLRWRETNTGVGATTASWSDSIQVRNTSNSQTVFQGVLPYDASALGALAAGAFRDRELTLVWPAGTAGIGRFEFAVAADADGQIFENNASDNAEGNNTATLTVNSAPDLRVDNLRTSPAASEAGATITVLWDTVNAGIASTVAGWSERIRIYNATTGDTLVDARVAYDPSLGGNGQILPGGSRSRAFSVTLPEGLRAVGTLTVSITTDVNGQVIELNDSNTGESNNTSSVNLEVTKRKYADLVPTSFTAPASARGGDTVTIRWTVTNQGEVATPSQWSDRLVLSSDSVYGNADDVILVNAPHFGILAPGESYTQERQVVLPMRADGAYRLFLRSDVNQEVLEPDTRGNNTFGPQTINIAAPHADLVVEAVSAPAAALSGESVKVSWRVRNNGDTTTDSSQWKDFVYLSTDTTLDASDTLLAQVDRSGLFLPVGESYTDSANVFLQHGITGNYYFLVRTDGENRVYEANFETNNTTAAFQRTAITPAPLPDLQISSISLPSTAAAGQQVHVTWTGTNSGGGSAKGPWSDRVYLSANDGVSAATYLGDVTHTGSLEAGTSYTGALDFIMPSIADGTYKLIVITDLSNQIYEGVSGSAAESNNQTASAASLQVVHPDLLPEQLDAPATAFSGNQVTLTYVIRNAGTGQAAGNWLDRVYLSRDTTIDAADTLLATRSISGPLAAGQTYGGSVDVDLPLGAQGTYYLLVSSDAAGNVPELGAEGNNVASRQLDVSLSDYAQLVTSGVLAPTLTIGDPAQISVSWTVSNQGTGFGRTPSWTDALIASTDNIVGNGDDRVVGEFVHDGGLAVGQSYTRTETFLLPAYFQGRYHFFVRSDAKNQVFENGNEADNASESSQIFDVMAIPYSDLVVSEASVPVGASSGQSMSVSWKVSNQGIGPTDIAGWNDEIVLTSDAAGTNVVANLGSFTHLGVLAAGDSYSRTQDVTLPNGLSGNYYVRVRTYGPFEFVYTTNNGRVAGPVNVALSPSPDLQVTDIQTPASASEGDYIDIKWTVTNNGQAKAEGAWTDTVYMRKVGQPNDPGIYLGTFSYDAGGLDAGKYYTRTERFKLPPRTEGVYQAVVVTNPNATVYEHGVAATNNTAADDQVLQVALLPRSDLQVGTVIAPDRASAGSTVSLRFSIINQGTVPTSTPRWRDSVYLSLDNKLTGDDLLIGSYDNGAALNPGELYATDTAAMQIPIRYRGDVFLIIQADSSGSVDEYPNDANNISAVPLYVEPYPLSDLIAGSVVAPAQAVEGSSIEVRYTVANKGSGTTAGNNWTDTIWLSRDKTRPNAGGNSAILLGTLQHSGALAVGSSYDVLTHVNLPAHMSSGTYYVTVWSDSYDVILEDTLASNLNPDDPNELDNNNYKARAIDVIGGFEPPPPDLTISALAASPTASTSSALTINWTVDNIGAGEASGSWNDVFWLSDMPTLGAQGAKVWYLGSIAHDGGAAPGSSYSNSATFALNPAAAGKYVLAYTDYNPYRGKPYDVVEGNEENNARTTDTSVTALPADLKVVTIAAPAENFSGEKTTVTWTVKNYGGTVWDGTRYWLDSVYLSPDPVFLPERAIALGTFVHSNKDGLAAGASYTESAEVTLPRGIGGNYYLYVITDANPYDPRFPSGELDAGDNAYARDVTYAGSAYEGVGGQDNNRGIGSIPVTYREPDLKVTTLVVPPAGGQSGSSVTVQYTVTNIGNRDTREIAWWDRLFLSKDGSLDTYDLQLSEARHYGMLKVGESYTGSATFKLPEGISGDFSLLAFTDSEADARLAWWNSNIVPEYRGVGIDANSDSVPEFRGEGNNITVTPLPVAAAPLADLQVTVVSAPEHITVGNDFTVTYTVGNLGGAGTPPEQGSWEDLIYLSRDPLLDLDSDRYMWSVQHTGGLAQGASYTVSKTLRAPLDISGAWYVFVVTDPARGSGRGKVFEGGFERNNATPNSPPSIFELPPPADVQVDDIVFGGNARAGENLHVEWTVSNHSTNPTSSGWTDAVYLSDDNIWDISDRLIGKVDHHGVLGADGTYTSSLDALVPPTKPGQYRVIVRPDIYNEVFEGPYRSAGEANNFTTSPNVLTVAIDELHLGVPLPTTLSTGQSRVYKLTVGQGETLKLSLTAADQDATNEIFIRYGDVPDGYNYDATYENPLQANQTAVIPFTKPGDYYVLIRGHSEPKANAQVRLLAEVVPFAITSVHVDQGGDSRWVTFDVRGAKFADNAILKLVRPDVAEYEPVKWEVMDSTWIRATFDFRDAPLGLYDLKVINPDGKQAIDAYRFLIERALEPDVTIGLGGPRVLAAGETGIYGVALQSLTNVDTPYVRFTFGVPEMGNNQYVYDLPFLKYYNNLRGQPDTGAADVPWASLDSATNTTGQILSSGYAYDVIAGGYVGATFNVTTYPLLKALSTLNWDALRVGLYEMYPALEPIQALAGGPESMQTALPAYWDLWLQAGSEEGLPDDCVIPFIPYRFNIVGAATAMTRDEFIADQTLEALKLRAAILGDTDLDAKIAATGTDDTTLAEKRAAIALRNLAADPEAWVNAYLAALEQVGIIRPVDEAPPIRQDIKVMSLMSTLATGILLGPVGDQLRTTGDIVEFFAKIKTWYGDTPATKAAIDHYEHRESDCLEGDIPVPALPKYADYDLKLSHPTYFETFNIFVPYVGFSKDGASAATIALPDYASVAASNTLTALDFSRLYEQAISDSQLASMSGPQGYGVDQFLPVGQALPYTVKFENPSAASGSVTEIRVVSELDPALDPTTFRLGDIKLGDVTVHIPTGRALFQGDFDLRNAKGFILRVSAGIDPTTHTASWVFQAIDPETGEVLQDATRGLLLPNSGDGRGVGQLGYSVQPKADLPSGTQVSASAVVRFNSIAPQETRVLTQTLDTGAPVTSLTATPVSTGGSDYEVRWTSVDEERGSGVAHVTVYVAKDGGDFKIWLRQTTDTFGIYAGEAGHSYEFLALATDHAGNREKAPGGVQAPDDGSAANLGGLPSFGETTVDLPAPPAPTAPSTNPLFIEAEKQIPAATALSKLPEFTVVERPFTAQAYATDFVDSHGGVGALAMLELADGSVIASGGPNRGWLYHIPHDGGRALTPFVELDEPIFDLALDDNGQLWATTGGGSLLRLDLASGQILARFGTGITQALAIKADTGEIYVSSGDGIEIFNPVTGEFRHFSDVRVDDLAFAPDGTLWGSTWPARGDVVTFDHRGRATVKVRLDGAVDSIAFGQVGTRLEGLLFVSSNSTKGETGAALTMVDLVSLRSVEIARGGSRGETVVATADGRVLVAETHHIDVISPIVAPRVIATNPPDMAVVPLPLSQLTVTFDQDMYAGAGTDSASVLNTANFQVVRQNGGLATITGVSYDAATRTAILTVTGLEPDLYDLRVLGTVRSSAGMALGSTYISSFVTAQDFSSVVQLNFERVRSDRGTGVVSYDVTITNLADYDLMVPASLVIDPARFFQGRPMGAVSPQGAGGLWYIDLSGKLPGGVLKAGASISSFTVGVTNGGSQQIVLGHGIYAVPYPNAKPVFTSTPVTAATAGQAYAYQAVASDPDGAVITYLLLDGPAGLVLDGATGALSWLPTASSPASASVLLRAYDTRGGFDTQTFLLEVAGANRPPEVSELPAQIEGKEGQTLLIGLSALDPDEDFLHFYANNLPPGAIFDPNLNALVWTPDYTSAGTYNNIELVVSDGKTSVTRSFALLIAPDDAPPELKPVAERTIREGDPVRIQLQASDVDGDKLTFFADILPVGAFLDPNTGVLEWTPSFIQAGDYALKIGATDGTKRSTTEVRFHVLNVNAAPVFDELGSWISFEGQTLAFRAFAFDPDNPGFIPQDRQTSGTLTEQEGSNATVTYVATDLPAGASFDPVTAMFTWIPGYDAAGSYTVRFLATDDGNGTGSPLSTDILVPINIRNANRAPEMAAVPTQVVQRDTVFELPVAATDPDGNPLTLSVSGLPAFASFTENGNGSGKFVFAPHSGDRGDYEIVLTATDNGDGQGALYAQSFTRRFILTAASASEAPVLAPLGNKVALVGQKLAFTINAKDLDQDTLAYAMENAPAGMTPARWCASTCATAMPRPSWRPSAT